VFLRAADQTSWSSG